MVTALDFDSYDSAAAWCDGERANLVTAVTVAVRHGLHDICAQLAESVFRSFLRSPWSGWIQVLEHGIASASILGDDAAQGWLHNSHMGIALSVLHGSQLEAIDSYERALPLPLMNLGSAYLEAGQLEPGTARIEEGLSEVNTSSDPHTASIGLTFLADAYRQLGRHAEAISSAEQALEISQRVHDDYNEAAALATLGQVLVESGEMERGRSCLEKALELAERLGVPEVKHLAASLAALDRSGEG